MHPKNNEQVFDATVREMLEIGGVTNLEQPPDSLSEAIEHGEGTRDSALNFIVQAHVAHLISDVWLPFEKDPWTEQLGSMKPRFRQGLEMCHKLLIALPPLKRPGPGMLRLMSATGIVAANTYFAGGELMGEAFSAILVPASIPVIGYELLENLRFRVNPVTREIEKVPEDEIHPPYLL